MSNNRIKDLPPSEQPYEKFRNRGPEALSDAELLAVILKSGVRGKNVSDISRKIIEKCQLKGGIGYLNRLAFSELINIDGIGFVKAAQIRCICELSKRMWEQSRGKLKRFTSANEIASFYMQYIKGLEKEETFLIMLDGGNHIISDMKLSIGCINASILSCRDVYINALSFGAVSIIIMHNHPSGNPSPSVEDKVITSQLQKAGILLDIPLLDHIIIGDNCYYSFKESGLI